ncbi:MULTISPECIES: TIGR03118 family protein [unclassified Duganella]|uniref:TIGR03118 family protein n=1 Tax=unclassified Duganella TaxID=2636909 RepID=UPI000E35295F|nr:MULTISPECIES: TIGR03118 family protein [unclassified Duganella]RFP19109.1 TIGR03118 family protein [Duganella sp. BJB475]RFP35771.1 TIGR03118 family protein [Duganella sp. BJB476]
MHTRTCTCTALTALSLTLSACGGGGYDAPMASPPVVMPPVVASQFKVGNLVGDIAGSAAQTDAKLVNAWGIAFNPSGFVWVANNGSSTSTLYDGSGVPQTLVVATPPAPTGIVYNGSGDFRASPFIFATESGKIAAWSPTVDRNNALTVFDGAGAQAVYKGLAIATWNNANYLYAADFHNNRVDVFDAGFNKVTLSGAFRDAALPANYAPFGIQAVGDRIYIAFAQRESGGDDEVAGAGLGAIDVFDTAGNLIKQLVMGGALNAPWGMAMAPSNFGSFSGKLLVGNFGDGKINAYDPASGAMSGTLSKADGSAIVIDGLWGIAFGPGVNNQPANTLFFAAGPGGETHGLYGRIDML